MHQYLDILRTIRLHGRQKKNRTGVDALTIKGPSMTFRMDDGFPLGTYRPIFMKGITGENIWFIDGKCNNEDLLAMGIKIWNQWALPEDIFVPARRNPEEAVHELVKVRRAQQEARGEEVKYEFGDAVAELTKADGRDSEAGLPVMGKPLDATSEDELMGGHKILRDEGISFIYDQLAYPKGYLGPIYGVLWRGWVSHTGERVDQLANIFNKLASDNPKLRYSRANIITSFNPAVLPDETVSAQENIQNGRQALAACHTMFQLIAEPLTLEERVEWHNRKVAEDQKAHDESGHPADVTWNYLDVEALWTMSSIPAQDFDEEAGHAVLDKLGVARDQLSLILYQRKHNCALAA